MDLIINREALHKEKRIRILFKMHEKWRMFLD
jgi:hypothetical protein